MTVPFLPPRHDHITPLHTEQACSPGAQRAVFPRRAPPALAPPAPTLKAPFCWKAGPAATESPHTRARELGLHPASQTHLEAGRSQGPTGQPGPRVDVCASGANTSRAPRFWPVRLGGLSDQQPIPSTIWHRAHSQGPLWGAGGGAQSKCCISSASSSWDRVTCAEGSLLARTPVWTGSGVLGTPKALMHVGAGCLWTSGGALPAACSRAKAPLADACPGHPCCQAQQVQSPRAGTAGRQ